MKKILTIAAILLQSTLLACSDESHTANMDKTSGQRVNTAITALRDTQSREQLSGSLQANRTAHLHNQQPGTVTHIYAYPGDRVKAGALLAQLDDRLLSAQRDRAMAILQQTELDAQRAETLANNKLIAEDALARARTSLALAQADAKLAQAQFDYSRISAPFAGVISERLIEEGDVLANQTPLFTLLDTQNLKAQLFVSENWLPQLSVNDVVTIHSDSAGTDAQGKISRVSPGLDPQTRQGEIEISLHANAKQFMPGQLCHIMLQGKIISRLMIPFGALRHDTQGAFVFKVQDNQVRRSSVKTGYQQDDFIEITHGLVAGDVVVIRGFTGLHDGKKVSVMADQNPADANTK